MWILGVGIISGLLSNSKKVFNIGLYTTIAFYWLVLYTNQMKLGYKTLIYGDVVEDVLAINLIWLTSLIIPIAILATWEEIKYDRRAYILTILTIELILTGVFLTTDLLWFFIGFEGVLIPTFFLIGNWGGKNKIKSAYMLLLYTIGGSGLLLTTIIYIYSEIGSTNNIILKEWDWNNETLTIIQIALLLAFAVKTPLWPLHIWLPKAHVEAPLAGSIILAGILLKLGGYGIIRYSLGIFTDGIEYIKPLIYLICILGIIYGSLTTIIQTDVKRIIAYSSIGHMSLITLGLYSGTIEGITGGYILMIGHGIISPGLFMIATYYYERLRSRTIRYYRGLSALTPLMTTCLFILTLGNIGFPGTINFIGEFLILEGLYEENKLCAILSGTGVILSVAYGILAYNRIAMGQGSLHINKIQDISRREWHSILLIIITIWIHGINPSNLYNSSIA